MKLYFIAGEASGDLHGSNLLKELNKHHSSIQARGFGGDLMQNEGLNLSKHYRDLAFMGFVEVIMNLRTILKNISFCKQDILDFKPDAIILIDYPGFNLKIAEYAKKSSTPSIESAFKLFPVCILRDQKPPCIALMRTKRTKAEAKK